MRGRQCLLLFAHSLKIPPNRVRKYGGVLDGDNLRPALNRLERVQDAIKLFKRGCVILKRVEQFANHRRMRFNLRTEKLPH